jgi:hypothetical protein
MGLWSTPPSYSFSRIPHIANVAGVATKAALNSAAATLFTYANSVNYDIGRSMSAFFESLQDRVDTDIRNSTSTRGSWGT